MVLPWNKKTSAQAMQNAAEVISDFKEFSEETAREIAAIKTMSAAPQRFQALLEIENKIKNFQQQIKKKIDQPLAYQRGSIGGATVGGMLIGLAIGACFLLTPFAAGGACLLAGQFTGIVAGGFTGAVDKQSIKRISEKYILTTTDALQSLTALTEGCATEIASAFKRSMEDSAQETAAVKNIPDAGERYTALLEIENKIDALQQAMAQRTGEKIKDLPDTRPLLQETASQKAAILRDEFEGLAQSPRFSDLYDRVPAIKDAFIKATAQNMFAAPRTVSLDKTARKQPPAV